MQKRSRDGGDMDFLSCPANIKAIQCFLSGGSLALGGAKTGEIVMADQSLGRLVHGVGIQVFSH
tara:strand:- start:80 stop:271 length:192 start_codon:yes stop_codon:yes gene_type:complete